MGGLSKVGLEHIGMDGFASVAEPEEKVLVNGSVVEYMLVVVPEREVLEEIYKLKADFSAEYCVDAGAVMPNINVAAFYASEGMEETMIRWMQKIFAMNKSFVVTLNNFSGFPGHTVYLRVADPAPFQWLAQELKPLKEFIGSSACPPAKLVSHPHLSICRKLPEPIYRKAMLDYSQKSFHASFTVDQLLLLKRTNVFEQAKPVNIFRLHPAAS
ncbi:MAG: 2'-5' RNA ligase family protein [Gemmatimonadaceae bacterium]|nr:2'-5' RNA ligase family protein [Chitinophagaceae bacterium]